MMRRALLLAALVLAARFGSADDKARSRDGSSGGSSDAGARHHSSSSSSSSSASEDHGSSSAASSDASDPTPAQRRHPRAGTGTGYSYGNGYYGYPYYGSFYFGYPAYYYAYAGDPAYYGAPAYYGHPHDPAAYGPGYPNVGSLRLIVEPEKTKVYVDGYYAGIVDDFDGHFQRLDLSPRPHHVEIRAPGYQPLVFDGTIGGQLDQVIITLQLETREGSATIPLKTTVSLRNS
jgi:hypothetical protein